MCMRVSVNTWMNKATRACIHMHVCGCAIDYTYIQHAQAFVSWLQMFVSRLCLGKGML
jgi:hypothetical protein